MTFLLGRHATLGQDPPIYFRSTAAVHLPSLAIVQAINLPAVPLPSRRTSYFSAPFMSFVSFGGWFSPICSRPSGRDLSTRASPVPLLESRPRLHRAQYASDCGLRGAPESSRPSAPPCSAASPAQSCHPLPLTETTMVSFSRPAHEPSPECISPRAAAARLPESL